MQEHSLKRMLLYFSGIGRRRVLEGVVCSLRYYCTAASPQAVDKSTLSKLRKKTGFPLLNCRKALEKFDNDLKQVKGILVLEP